MPRRLLRTVQPAHKSDRITVEQAKEAWLAVEREARECRSKAIKRKAGSAARSSAHPGDVSKMEP